MDIKHVLSRNPLLPAYDAARVPARPRPPAPPPGPSHPAGTCEIGHAGERVLLRQRAAPPPGLPRALRPGRPAGDLRRVAGLHRGRGLPPARALAVRRVGHRPVRAVGAPAVLVPGRRRAGTSSPWAARPRSTRPSRSATSATTRPMPSPAGPGAGSPPRPSGRWRAAGRPVEGHFLDQTTLHPTPVDRRRARPPLRRRLAVDLVGLQPLPRLRAGPRGGRRVQREVHGQPVRPAGRVVRHPAGPHPGHLPQLLPARGPLGLHRPAAGPEQLIRGIASRPTTAPKEPRAHDHRHPPHHRRPPVRPTICAGPWSATCGPG